MSNKVFVAIIAVIVFGMFGYVAATNKSEPTRGERPGVAHEDKGQKHVAAGEVTYGGPEPPTSGDHTTHIPWQAYEQGVPDENVIHNLEHGGVYISYRPDLPVEEVNRLKALFFEPFSDEGFKPNKAIMAPRAANDSPIIMSSWNRSMKFESFDEEKMVEYYRRNIGKSPEATAS